MLAQLRVPIDDEHSFLFRVIASPDRPLTADERATDSTHGVFVPEMIPGTTACVENIDNDYLIDRERAAHATRSPASSRSSRKILRSRKISAARSPTAADEMLTSSDRAIIALRKRLLTTVQELAERHRAARSAQPESVPRAPRRLHAAARRPGRRRRQGHLADRQPLTATIAAHPSTGSG